MSTNFCVEKINTRSNTRQMVDEEVAIETPVNLFINDEYVITLLATPELRKELALGWLFTEGVLQSIDQITQTNIDNDNIHVTTQQPISEGKLRVVSVSRLLTTACGLSAKKFFTIMSDLEQKAVESEYAVKADAIISMVNRLDESRLFSLTGGVHVAALFENERLIAFAEDVGRHNTIDKVVGLGIQSNVNFSNSVLVSSGRQPADMILKAARMGIPIVVSKAAPIRSGIIAAEKTGITLACFARDPKMNVYTHHSRIL
ncbi:MAG: formate dehydrogenase accessory sulfurtransferase FdhD [Candidatus Bathyarchaeota archaeon]|nr:formate dehydrogenase accessory sulfurtransferase FdhD [Candidatus Bathyarchaeota archaeon]